MFYQGGPIDNCTHVPDTVSQSIAESEYNAAYTSGMAIEYLRMLNNELLNKDPGVVPGQSPLIILDIKSAICMAKNGTDTKHSRHFSRRMHFVINVEKCNF